MNFVLAQCMVHRPRVLRGGQAPHVFKRELSGLTEGVGTMPRRCDWVREIVETHPRLLSEPLFGTCLAAVTATRVVRSDGNDESTENRLSSPHLVLNRDKEIVTESTALSKRDQIRSPAVRSQRSEDARQFEAVSQLPRRAPDSLLRRAAPEHVTENQIGATLALPHGQPGSPPVNLSPVTRSEWLGVIADRAAKKWIADWVFPPTRKYLSAAVDSNRRERAHTPETGTHIHDGQASSTAETVETVSLPSLNDNWLLPIGGPQASPQLLTSLVNHARSDRETPEQTRRNKETFSGNNAEPHGLSTSLDPLATPQQSFSDGPELSRPLKFDRQSPSLPANQNLSSPLEAINSAEREQRVSPDLAPTVLTPDLSALLPPAAAGSPVMSAAADTARRIAWRDEVEAHGTDLSVLATQMKRILDEEARRHGIDV